MATYITTTTNATGTPASTVPAAPTSGANIAASTFQQMLTVLEDLNTHTHQSLDWYTSVCQCQCACSRGIL